METACPYCTALASGVCSSLTCPRRLAGLQGGLGYGDGNDDGKHEGKHEEGKEEGKRESVVLSLSENAGRGIYELNGKWLVVDNGDMKGWLAASGSGWAKRTFCGLLAALAPPQTYEIFVDGLIATLNGKNFNADGRTFKYKCSAGEAERTTQIVGSRLLIKTKGEVNGDVERLIYVEGGKLMNAVKHVATGKIWMRVAKRIPLI